MPSLQLLTLALLVTAASADYFMSLCGVDYRLRKVTMIQSAWRKNITSGVMRHGMLATIASTTLKFLLVTLLFGTSGARADTFSIEFMGLIGGVSGSGTFTTASGGGDVLTFMANLASDTSQDDFDYSNNEGCGLCHAVYDPETRDFLSYFLPDTSGVYRFFSYTSTGVSTDFDEFPFGWAIYTYTPEPYLIARGQYMVFPVTEPIPEPCSVILLVSVVTMLGLLTRRTLAGLGGLAKITPDPSA
jgi:hypothetical protein